VKSGNEGAHRPRGVPTSLGMAPPSGHPSVLAGNNIQLGQKGGHRQLWVCLEHFRFLSPSPVAVDRRGRPPRPTTFPSTPVHVALAGSAYQGSSIEYLPSQRTYFENSNDTE